MSRISPGTGGPVQRLSSSRGASRKARGEGGGRFGRRCGVNDAWSMVTCPQRCAVARSRAHRGSTLCLSTSGKLDRQIKRKRERNENAKGRRERQWGCGDERG